jgi:hypothetical protein
MDKRSAIEVVVYCEYPFSERRDDVRFVFASRFGEHTLQDASSLTMVRGRWIDGYIYSVHGRRTLFVFARSDEELSELPQTLKLANDLCRETRGPKFTVEQVILYLKPAHMTSDEAMMNPVRS